jgi:DNA-binding response OmpR family regulator
MIRIIWADDQVDVIHTFKKLLAPIESEIDISNNCTDAFEKIKQNHYHLLILDLMMPPGQWGGLWLLEELKNADLSIPTLILSGEGTQTETIKALRLGANDYVAKEKIEDELLDQVKKLIETSMFKVPSSELIKEGETERVEFKSTLRWNIFSNKIDKSIEHSALKTITAFLNSEGGILIIGVDDCQNIIGLQYDKFKNSDKMNLHLINLIKSHIGIDYCNFIQTNFEKIEGKEILRIDIGKAKTPAFLKHGKDESFYIRTGPASTNLPVSKVHDYIKNRFD